MASRRIGAAWEPGVPDGGQAAEPAHLIGTHPAQVLDQDKVPEAVGCEKRQRGCELVRLDRPAGFFGPGPQFTGLENGHPGQVESRVLRGQFLDHAEVHKTEDPPLPVFDFLVPPVPGGPEVDAKVMEPGGVNGRHRLGPPQLHHGVQDITGDLVFPLGDVPQFLYAPVELHGLSHGDLWAGGLSGIQPGRGIHPEGRGFAGLGF